MNSPCDSPQDPGTLTEVLYAVEGQVATVTIDRPRNFNACSTGALAELARCFTAAGNTTAWAQLSSPAPATTPFCTGGDVKECEAVYTRRPHDYWKYMGMFAAYIESILGCGKPVVARLNGMAVGGGNESQLACDLSLIGNHAYIKQVGTHVGSVACGGGTQLLALFVGERRAREILLLNEPTPPPPCAWSGGWSTRWSQRSRCPTALSPTPTADQIRQAREGQRG